MSLPTTVARRAFRRTPALRRLISSQSESSPTREPSTAPKPSPTPKTTLSPRAHGKEFALNDQRLRALVALYHKTVDFITHDNLDAAIDEAFIYSQERKLGRNNRDKSYADLLTEVRKQRSAPKFGRPDVIHSSGFVIDEKDRRVVQLFQALYGTVDERNPGLDLVQEKWEETHEWLEIEKKVAAGFDS